MHLIAVCCFLLSTLSVLSLSLFFFVVILRFIENITVYMQLRFDISIECVYTLQLCFRECRNWTWI